MTLPRTLSTEPLEYPAMDYAFLRREGIRLLEQLGGQLWTDFNAHDPGITILEQVCYAITDLGYRINYDIKDLLASTKGDPYGSIFSAAAVLTVNPVTILDLRKLVLDVPGVRNAWIERVGKPEPGLVYDPSEMELYLDLPATTSVQREAIAPGGIYQVSVEKDADSNLDEVAILEEVNRRLHACRALCEDFMYPDFLARQDVSINASIEISAVDDPEGLLAKIYLALAEFISPHVNFYTLDEMLRKGKRIDEILNGPTLQHGFIEDAELEKLEKKTSLRTSDLIQEIMNVEGVVAVNSISIESEGKTEDWYLNLDPERVPFFDIKKSVSSVSESVTGSARGNNHQTIRLTRGTIEAHLNPDRVWNIIKTLQTGTYKASLLPESQRDVQLQMGTDQNVSHYFSIQQQFPATYGIGSMGLPESAPPQRKAQAKQLKAYLLFFDQLLANYFAQLGNALNLFSFDSQRSPSYFSQVVEDDGLGLAEILKNDNEIHAENIQAFTENPESEIGWSRKNRFLNHLLARFAEQFTDYSLLQYANFREEDLVNDKSAFLRAYKEIGKNRGSGFDYTQPAQGGTNRSGLEKRIGHKLGIPTANSTLVELDEQSNGGFYLLEHILLRPREIDSGQYKQTSAVPSWQAGVILAQSQLKDPYSQQISFIIPAWIERFNEPEFSKLIEKTIREETPAHIRVYIHRLDKKEMLAFESARKDWLEGLLAGELWQPPSTNLMDEEKQLLHVKIRDARDRLIQALGIGLPYPLRDLTLRYPAVVAFDQSTTIRIEGAQARVRYQLHDEDGNPIVDKNGNKFEVQPDASEAGKEVELKTPNIKQDVTYTILAIREGGNPSIQLEVYLNQKVSIQSGVDINLIAAFLAGEAQTVQGDEISIPYSTPVTVQVFNSQVGISYKLVTVDGDNQVSLSQAKKGNLDTIELVTAKPILEDTPLRILAYRTSNQQVSSLLKNELFVRVRPNPAVSIHVQPDIVDYAAEATVVLTGHQSTTRYQLYKRELVAREYSSDQTAGGIQIHTDEGRDIFIARPGVITGWESAGSFVLAGEFSDENGELSCKTGSLLEDTLFIVRATKTQNGESLQVEQVVAVLVGPNPDPVVDVLQAEIAAKTAGVVTVSETQKGVSYQLRLDADDTPVNPPGFDRADRGVATTRLEVDFMVEQRGEPILWLPTGPISETTTFNILAEKILTGVSVELTGKVEIKVSS